MPQNWYRAMKVSFLLTKQSKEDCIESKGFAEEDISFNSSSVVAENTKFDSLCAASFHNDQNNLVHNDQEVKKDCTNLTRSMVKDIKSVDALRECVLSFEGCALKGISINTVFSDGLISDSTVMLIGEAPGDQEDKQGIPFCGESGKLLDRMLASIALSRQTNVYITNTVFWRPPGNRRPTSSEIESCRPFVEKHIALVKPKLLVLVGGTAATSLLGNQAQITKIRQIYYQYTNQYLAHYIPTTAIFHPAYLLRQPGQKKAAWYDLLKIRQFLDSGSIN